MKKLTIFLVWFWICAVGGQLWGQTLRHVRIEISDVEVVAGQAAKTGLMSLP